MVPSENSDGPGHSTWSDESLLYAPWIAKDPRFLHEPSEDSSQNSNWESLAQFENQIKNRVYIRRITHSTNYVWKSSILLARTGERNISSVACRFSPIKTHFSDYPKSLISRIKTVYVFFN